jgi:hypothetical protein
MKGAKFRYWKAFMSFLFAITWFIVTCVGLTLLMLPQITVNAYGKEVDWLSKWCDFMDELFNSFKEI